MARLTLLFTILIIACCVAVAPFGRADPAAVGSSQPSERSEGSGQAASDLLRVQKVWNLPKGDSLKFYSNDDHITLTKDSGEALFEFQPHEVIFGVAISPDSTRMLVLTMWQAGGNQGLRAFRYNRLVLISRVKAKGWIGRAFLAWNERPMNQRHRSISEIDAVSNDGDVAHVEFGEADREDTPYTVAHGWKMLRLSDGLEVETRAGVPEK
jgi:hypothetical protein